MSGKISNKSIKRNVTIGPILSFRCFFDNAGVGVNSLSPTMNLTNPLGSGEALVLNTDYVRTELSNIAGDYELGLLLTRVSSVGNYTVEIDSGDVDVGKAVDHMTALSPFGTVTSASATANWTTLPVNMTDFYKYGLQRFMTGSLTTAGPRQITASTSGGYLTTESWISSPSSGDIFMVVDL